MNVVGECGLFLRTLVSSPDNSSTCAPPLEYYDEILSGGGDLNQNIVGKLCPQSLPGIGQEMAFLFLLCVSLEQYVWEEAS